MTARRLSDLQHETLRSIVEHHAGYWCVTFKMLEPEDMERRRRARVATRALARMGLVKLSHAMSDDDGTLCGSGYIPTREGMLLVEEEEAR